MTKVLHIVGCIEKGGTEAFIMNNYRKLYELGYIFDFYVVNPDSIHAYVDEIKKMGGFIYKGNTFKHKLKSLIELIKILKDNEYNVIHCNINEGNVLPLLAAKICKVPIRISHSHNTFGKRKGISHLKDIIDVFIIKRCGNKFLACSNEAGDYLYGKSFFKKNGIIIKNGIDVKKYTNVCSKSVESLKSELNIKNDELIVGNISRFDSQKNPLFVVDVFNELLKLEPSCILLMGGVDGGLLEKTKNKVRKYNIENKVRFIGVRTDMEVCLNLIDYFLFPSLFEGLGIVLLEAQASGCACFVSDVIPHEVDMGLNLIKFISLDETPENWAKAIIDNEKKCNNNLIIKLFKENGYDIESSSVNLAEIYNG